MCVKSIQKTSVVSQRCPRQHLLWAVLDSAEMVWSVVLMLYITYHRLITMQRGKALSSSLKFEPFADLFWLLNLNSVTFY